MNASNSEHEPVVTDEQIDRWIHHAVNELDGGPLERGMTPAAPWYHRNPAGKRWPGGFLCLIAFLAGMSANEGVRAFVEEPLVRIGSVVRCSDMPVSELYIPEAQRLPVPAATNPR